MNEPFATLLCGVGVALLLNGGDRTIASFALLGAALYGASRILASRAILWMIAALVVAWCFHEFWELAPASFVRERYGFQQAHATLYDLPAHLSSAAWIAVLASVPILGRARIGLGLVVLTLGSIAISVVAAGVLLLCTEHSNAFIVSSGTSSGFDALAAALVALSFLAIAVPAKVTPVKTRATVSIGAAGAALLCALLHGMPQSFEGGRDEAILACVGTTMLAWILVAIGLGGFAKSGGRAPAWVAMGLAILEVLLVVASAGVAGRDFAYGIGIAAAPAFLGLGLAAVTARSVDLPRARGVAGVLFLVATFGAAASGLALLAGSARILHFAKPLWALSTFTFPAAHFATAFWAACLAYLVAPPSDKVVA